ncbi:MAG: ABC transporter ATP-binding protein [Proteobacteria bacterium]|nr:ABC transporter ATP-binding protein [Pseudomonadota bacterium]
MKTFYGKFLFILGNERKKIKYLLLLFLFSSMLDLFGIALIGPFLNNLFNSETGGFFSEISKGAPVYIGIMIVAAFCIKGVTAYYVAKTIVFFSYRQQGILVKKIMGAYQKYPYEHLVTVNTAEIINTINNYSALFASGVLMNILDLWANCFVALVIIGFLAYQDWIILGILVGMLALVIFIYDYFFKVRFERSGKECAQAQEQIIRGVNHAFGGLKEIRLLGVEDYFYRKVSVAVDKYANEGSISSAFQILPRYLIETVMIVFVVSVLIIYSYLGRNIQEIVYLFGIFGVAAMRLMPSSNQIIVSMSKVRFSLFVIDRLYETLLEIERFAGNQERNDAGRSKFKQFRQIVLKDVYFKYKNTEYPALKDINIVVRRGQSIGIIGESGSGKTTLVNLILGLLAPQSGEIAVDGVTINKNNLNEWRQLLAYIPQDIYLIDDTIARNVALGIEDAMISFARLERAMKSAQIWDFVNQLPKGIDTMVGERGIMLSGGQRQRIAIARAIYHDHDIIVMDEGTSALDDETESAVVKSIAALKGDYTLIVIAHRYTTLKNCDLIYKMSCGAVIDSGEYQVLCQ